MEVFKLVKGNYLGDGDHIYMVALSARIDQRKTVLKYHLIRSLQTMADWGRMSRSGKSGQKLLPNLILF
jgi:hypothetical protein